MNPNTMELFSEACGATGPLLVDVLEDGDTHRARRILHQPFLICGRHPEADLTLRNELVGRRHCYLQLVDGHVYGIDLGTRAGMRVNGQSNRSGWIGRAEELRVGPVGLSLRGGDRGDPAPPLDGPSPLSARYSRQHRLPGATLEIASAGEKPHCWRMSRVLVLIGRTAACKLKLISPLVSEIHCALLRTTAGVWLIDLLSQGGVYVDGVRTRVCALDEGAELSIGPFSIRLRYESAARARKSRTVSGSNAPRREGARFEDRSFRSSVENGALGMVEEVPALLPASEPTGSMTAQLRQILMLAKVFGDLDHDPAETSREDCEEIRRLAAEIQALRAELAAHQATCAARAGNVPFASDLTGGQWESDHSGSRERSRGAGVGPDLGSSPFRGAAWATQSFSSGARFPRADDSYGADVTNILRKDPRELHAIASQFLSAYNLERLSLREKIIRILLGPSNARPMMR